MSSADDLDIEFPEDFDESQFEDPEDFEDDISDEGMGPLARQQHEI